MTSPGIKPVALQLLAPARDISTARQAILHGADAVYIGAESFGARAAAGNPIEDIAALVEYAHKYQVRIYITLNTLIYDNELADAEALIKRLYRAGVDALIVQDLAVLRMDIPPIELHASTQCDIRTPAKARFLQDCGFSQLVLPRELSLAEIRSISDAVDIPLEAFVHGALCVSYSGDCQASLLATGRSANRGECAQMCRLKYSLTDAAGRQLRPDAYYLSLRDMNRLDRLADLADAGITSFKIEGRLKDELYVSNVVAAYSHALDDIVAASDGRYCRDSLGRSDYGFSPDVSRTFNRRFTPYFLDGNPPSATSMASLDSPKWIGLPVAKVTSCNGRRLKVKQSEPLNNGDGLGFFAKDGHYCGFRVNKVDGETVSLTTPIDIAPGTILYRNRDKRRDDMTAASSATRVIQITAILRRVDESHIALRLSSPDGRSSECVAECQHQPARSPQAARRKDIISRLGDTVYTLCALDDGLQCDEFVAVSILADLRRRTVAALDRCRRAAYPLGLRRPECKDTVPFKDEPLDRHDNVANHLAREFYTSHGMTVGAYAAEITPPSGVEERVMTTRYCLRRELGACLRTPGAATLPSPLFLRAPGVKYRLDFNCAACQMQVFAVDRRK